MSWPRSPLAEFVLFILAMAVLESAYVLALAWHGLRPSMLAVEFLQRAPGIVLVMWMVVDAKERRQTPCFDYGFFLLLLYPFLLFWYWTRTRGWRGLLFSLGLVLLSLAPSEAMIIVASL